MELERVIVAISLAVGDMHRGPATVDVTLCFRGNANETPPKRSHNQSHDLCIHPFRPDSWALCFWVFITSSGFPYKGTCQPSSLSSNLLCSCALEKHQRITPCLPSACFKLKSFLKFKGLHGCCVKYGTHFHSFKL